MKPPSFGYRRPETVAEALTALAEYGPEAKVLAGGQSLIPLLNMRLAAPKVLVDINRLGAELDHIAGEERFIRIGALVRHARLTSPDSPAHAIPATPAERNQQTLSLLAEATRHVAHPTIRNRGTTVGSLVHADPAAELPAVLLLCGGSVELASVSGSRHVPAHEFFVGPLESALAPGELAVAASFPLAPPRSGAAFAEISRRAGDYALAGVALQLTLGDDDRIASARAAYLSVAPTPVLVELTDAVSGTVDWMDAGALAQSQVDPEDDIHATASYRRHLVAVLTRRAGELALSRAREAANAC